MSSTTTSTGSRSEPHDNSIIETLQSLIVAFVLAMTFRGFVTEGFVIPTGSMAPTLLGRHKDLHSEHTGYAYPAGYDDRIRDTRLGLAQDPMLGPAFTGTGTNKQRIATRMGDRILVLKGLYHFSEPSRFDVVVFKNPTNPNGEDGNYIKRLIGLPDEALWLVDGDVFAGSADDPGDLAGYRIQRKPEHIQRAVWQPVYSSEYYPAHPEKLDAVYRGAPWQGEGWQTDGRPSYRCDDAGLTSIVWDPHIRTLDDWAAYNVLVQSRRQSLFNVSDVRIAASIVPDQEGLTMTFRLDAQQHAMEFIIGADAAQIRMRSSAYGDEHPDEGWEGPDPVEIDPLPAGRPTNVEFWHADQMLAIFVNGRRVVEYGYEWTPEKRLQEATGRADDPATMAAIRPSRNAEMTWAFEGSPVTLHRVRVDRDLYYRLDRVSDASRKNPTQAGFEDLVRSGQFAFGTHPANIAVLGPDHFFMAGDNSAASSDSRLWGNPHPIIAEQIDRSPFVVHRRLLLGKAWVVYFPAPHPLREGGRAFIPDFGRLRFIR